MSAKSLSLRAAFCLALVVTMSSACAGNGGLIPALESGFYYRIGGGNDVPLPAFYSTSYLPLRVDSDVGLGFDCGDFNPVASIRNSLNNIKNSALNVKRQILNNATGAVTEFPLYEISRADPNLYNLITNNMAGARQDIAVSTKSCEVMQSEIAAGQNPYAHWGQIALGHRWQQEIGTAELSGDGDINQARYRVSHDAGRSGVPWVNPNESQQTEKAGGLNQPPVRVIHDTAMAGYHVIVGNGASRLTQTGLVNQSSTELSRTFPSASDAAQWITNVVGDETITTYNRGQKSSQPGVGLYVDIQTQTKRLLPKLTALVAGSTPLTIDHLQTISPEGMALSPAVIESIRHQPKVVRGILVNKLAQNIAAMHVINKARLALRILQSGRRIPAIYSNQAAQHTIKNAMATLQHDVQNILMFIRARQALMSTMLATLVQAGQAEKAKSTAIAMPASNMPPIKRGAIPAGSATPSSDQ